ncbi:MAG TPA: hypothetical protein VE982_06275 [Gaiellaceae bacterium]|nr:hypothetical protein [Gaiellaceae bacterium]
MRARLVTVVLVALYLAVLGGMGGRHEWGRLGVPAGTLTFEDMRSVTTGWECTRRGVHVLALNPCDPFKRPANYPQVWMRLSFLGLGDGDTNVLGLVTAAVAGLAALLLVPAEAPAWSGVVYAAAICSPAVMLGFERGNVDLLIFALVVAGTLVLRRGLRGEVAGHALLLLAAVLKLFPVFAGGMLARRARGPRSRLLLAAFLIGFAVYALAILGEIRTIARVVPQTDLHSYGVRTVAIWWSTEVPPHSSRFWGLLFVAAAAVLAIRFAPRLPPGERRGDAEQRDLDLFWAGACIYVLTFAFFQSFDYRLVFLLATLPQLLRWTAAGSRLALATLAFLFLTLWLASPWTGVPVLGWVQTGWGYVTALHPVASYNPLSAAATAQLLLAFGLIAALAGTVPSRFRRRRHRVL